MCENGAWTCKSSTVQTAEKGKIRIIPRIPTGFAVLPDGTIEGKEKEPVTEGAELPLNDSGVLGGFSAGSLCDLTDDQIVKFYISEKQFGIPEDDKSEDICKFKAREILGSLGSYKLEAAKCKADAALECSARQEALNNCSKLKEDPTEIAGFVVETQCRRVSPPQTVKIDDKLYKVAEKWHDKDPAFADQLGDTADKTAQEKKSLDVFSYVFGNGDYGSKLRGRAAKLREVKEKLIASGASDAQTIAALEAQAQEFEAESDRFSNSFDISRIGGMFG